VPCNTVFRISTMSEAMLLTVTGLVESPRGFSFDELAAFDAAAQVSDVSTLDARRRGAAVTLKGLLAAVGPLADAKYLTLHASRDDFHASIPLSEVIERAVLIYRLDGAPLPVEAGGPVRFFIPDFQACHSADIDECANVKFIDCMELSREPGQDNRPESERAHAALHRGEPKA